MTAPFLPLSPPVPNISTSRLELVAITPEAMRSELAADGRLGEILDCRVTSEWPHADWEPHVFELLLTVFEERPEEIGWHRYIVLRDGPDGRPVLIGSTGGFRWPTDRRSAEVGYAIVPEFRLRGYAIEAAQAMISWIEGTGEVDHIYAHTFPELVGVDQNFGTLRVRVGRAGCGAGDGAVRLEMNGGAACVAICDAGLTPACLGFGVTRAVELTRCPRSRR